MESICDGLNGTKALGSGHFASLPDAGLNVVQVGVDVMVNLLSRFNLLVELFEIVSTLYSHHDIVTFESDLG